MKTKKCKHKLTLPLYARREDSWISTKQLIGKMVYICTKCNAILDRGFKERDVLMEKQE